MIKWTCKSFDELNLREWYNISMLRQQVFIVEQYCPYLDADGKDLKAHHLIGENQNGELLAYARLLPINISYENKASIGRIVASDKARGTGIGKELLEKSIEWMQKLYGTTPIKIGAQGYLEKFYHKFGFQTVSDVYLEDGIPHIDMELVFSKRN